MNSLLNFVVSSLQADRGHWVTVSKVSGVPYHTLTKIAQERTKNPRLDTVERLAKYYNRRVGS